MHSQFTVEPESVVQAEGLEAVFECLYPDASFHVWGINSIFPSDEKFPLDFVRQAATLNHSASLTIPALAQYNNTKVQCEAVFLGESLPKVSANATLQVQGKSLVALKETDTQTRDQLQAIGGRPVQLGLND